MLCDPNGMTLLLSAAGYGHSVVVERRVSIVVDVDDDILEKILILE